MMVTARSTLGKTGVRVSGLGLGCWGMSGSYGAADEQESIATLNLALDLGVNFLDTADSYGDGHNESLLGRALKSWRREFVLATKTGWVKRDGPDGKTSMGVDCRPERLRAACDASLTRLQTDVIDLYYLHRADPDVAIEESVGALADLVAAGKVRFVGLSEVSAETLRRANAVHPITAVQSEYSLWTRGAETSVLPACRELGVSFVAFSPLGRGFLTATVTDASQISTKDWRANNPRFTSESLAQNARLLATVQEVAREHGCTPGQVALAWTMSHQQGVIPIPGTKSGRHLSENVAALDVHLTPEEIDRLDAAFPLDAAAGERYTPEQAKWSGR